MVFKLIEARQHALTVAGREVPVSTGWLERDRWIWVSPEFSDSEGCYASRAEALQAAQTEISAQSLDFA